MSPLEKVYFYAFALPGRKNNLLIITQGDALGYGLTVLSGLFKWTQE